MVSAESAPCVYFKQLAPFLPERLDGFTVAHTQGSTGKYGEVSVSEAERLYTRGEGREVKVRIVDTTMGERIGKAIQEAADRSRGKAASDPSAPIHLDDAVGFVRYDAEESVAEANLLVGGALRGCRHQPGISGYGGGAPGGARHRPCGTGSPEARSELMKECPRW